MDGKTAVFVEKLQKTVKNLKKT